MWRNVVFLLFAVIHDLQQPLTYLSQKEEEEEEEQEEEVEEEGQEQNEDMKVARVREEGTS